MNKSIHKILLAGAMLGAMGGMPMPRVKTRGGLLDLPVIPERDREKFIKQYEKFLLRLKNHNNERKGNKKSKCFSVQGFDVYNFSEKNAKKKLRHLLGKTLISVDTTKEIADEVLKIFKEQNN